MKKKPKRMKIDLFGDGKYIDIPVPKGACSSCKWNTITIYIGDGYFHQPRYERCNGCSIKNGMKNYEEGIIDWQKITELTEENPVIIDKLLESWKRKNDLRVN